MKYSYHMKRERMQEVLEQIKEKSVAVIGDVFLDRYCIVDMENASLSREAPHHNRPVVSNIFSPGAAGNLAWNLKDLGAKEVFMISVIGNDHFGKILIEELNKRGVNTDYLIVDPSRNTWTYEKFYRRALDNLQEDPRVDTENYEEISKDVQERLIQNLKNCLEKVHAVAILDQVEKENIGAITNFVRAELIKLASEKPDVLFVADSRKNIDKFTGMTTMPNTVEAAKILEARFPSDKGEEKDKDYTLENIKTQGHKLGVIFNKPFYITVGEGGTVLFEGNSKARHIKTIPAAPPTDVTGIGDTFTAAVTLAVAAGSSFYEAGLLGNYVAGIPIKKIGMTGTATPEELLENYERFSKILETNQN